MAKYIVTIFKNIKVTKEPFHIPVEVIFSRIKNGNSRSIIEKIRFENDKKERNNLKMQLPSICFSGIFLSRSNDKCEKHSGLVAIDFDHLGDQIEIVKKRMINDPYTLSCFVSPSGDGLKVIVKIPAKILTHADSCRALVDYYSNDKLDNFEDVARVCYESFDPDIYINYDSKEFITLKGKEVKKVQAPESRIFDYSEIYERLKIWMKNNNEHYSDGTKHKYLVKFSSACLRFNIPELVTSQKLIFEYSTHPGCESVLPKDIDNIVSAVYKNYGHTAGTAYFTEKGELLMNDHSNFDISKIDITLPLKDVIYLDNVWEDMIKNFRTGLAIGETTYFKNSIDKHYKFKRGELTLFHGIGNHGKSTFLMQLLLIKSVFDGYKWAFFSPEQNPPSDFYDEIVHMYIGKNTLAGYKDQMSEDEYIKGMNFVKNHFFYIYPDNDAPTPEYINIRFLEVYKKHKIDGFIIDPYNQLDNDINKTGGREDLYLSAFLTNQKRIALKYNLFAFIISHPKGGLQKSNKGDYKEPNIYDLSGGAMWGNKCDNIICIYRPYATTQKTNILTKFISQKIKKQKLCGRPGEVNCYLDLKSMRFEVEGYKSVINNYGEEIVTNTVKENPLNEQKKDNNIIEEMELFYNEKGPQPF